MTVLSAYCQVLPDRLESFRSASHKNKTAARLEAGCERFDYYVSDDEPLMYVFVEEWSSLAHLQAHFATPHFAEFMATVESCLAAAPEIRIFEATLTD
ncbi:MAG: antibiotic biosynthesis monooxygenase [Armatimonadetes bacterium]|nr:antibiotic biosynthesis monooxygenase [Armatimonadota bacterium]